MFKIFDIYEEKKSKREQYSISNGCVKSIIF